MSMKKGMIFRYNLTPFLLTCERNPAHDVNFDWTVLGDVAQDYEQRQ